jgi:hypothetical protein
MTLPVSAGEDKTWGTTRIKGIKTGFMEESLANNVLGLSSFP